MGCSFRPDWVAGFLRIRWQLCTGLGGRNHRNTQTKTLEAEGWGVAIVWSCETKNIEPLASKLSSFLGPAKLSG